MKYVKIKAKLFQLELHIQLAQLVTLHKLYNAISALTVASYWPACWGHLCQPWWQVFNGPLCCAFGLCVCTERINCPAILFALLFRGCVSAATTASCCLAATFLPSEFLTLLHAVFGLVFRKGGLCLVSACCWLRCRDAMKKTTKKTSSPTSRCNPFNFLSLGVASPCDLVVSPQIHLI